MYSFEVKLYLIDATFIYLFPFFFSDDLITKFYTVILTRVLEHFPSEPRNNWNSQVPSIHDKISLQVKKHVIGQMWGYIWSNHEKGISICNKKAYQYAIKRYIKQKLSLPAPVAIHRGKTRFFLSDM